MDTLIIYFSQTGKTQKVAKTMGDAFNEAGHSVRSIPLKKAIPEDTKQCDVLGIGTPCFASQAPTPIKQFLRNLPSLENKKTFVFATSGGAPGRVLYDMTALLRKRGADVIGGSITRGECFYPAPCMIGRFPGRPNETDIVQARRFAQVAAEHISSGRSGAMQESRPDALQRGLGFYDIVGLTTPDVLIRLLMPKPKLDEELCNECQWCARECPMDNIIMHSYPVVGNRCIRCYRCINGCPQKAFKVSWLFADKLLQLYYNTIMERWFGDLKAGEQFY